MVSRVAVRRQRPARGEEAAATSGGEEAEAGCHVEQQRGEPAAPAGSGRRGGELEWCSGAWRRRGGRHAGEKGDPTGETASSGGAVEP